MLYGCGGSAAPLPAEPARPALHAIRVGAAEAFAAIVATPGEREKGLMGRTDLGPDEGMLFIFPSAGRQAFWMKDTPSPLSIAFITPDGRIAEITDMAPNTLDRHVSESDALMALEMPSGWFARNGVKPGDRVVVPEGSLPAAVR